MFVTKGGGGNMSVETKNEETLCLSADLPRIGARIMHCIREVLATIQGHEIFH